VFGSIGGTELILILVIALLIFGPRKLPEMGRSLGRGLAEFRKASTEFKNTLEKEIASEDGMTSWGGPERRARGDQSHRGRYRARGARTNRRRQAKDRMTARPPAP
jgi:TatA/E family protein of Tat protein translocase